jgi:cyclophilin family peptidyl-prolyl cis-trans isomerase
VQALGQPDPGPGEARALAVPASLDPAPLLGAGVHVTWLVATTRGEVRIALDPRRAPWTVASLVALTRAGAYDGLPFHRVVPGFVVQGGDPEGTGWGGPGYTLPAEPSDAPYAAGAVGIADAGADTGGSQWFVMHAAAPHLDGRYTQVGEVLAGQDVMDALVIGDEVVAARVEVTTGP